MNANGNITQVQREQMAQYSPATPEAQQLGPVQADQHVQRIRGGLMDNALWQQLAEADATPQAQAQATATSVQTPFGDIELPFTMSPIQSFSPFAGMPPMPMPGFQMPGMTPMQMGSMMPMQMPLMTPAFTPPTPALAQTMPATPSPFEMESAMRSFPQPITHSTQFPGGFANQSTISLPGGAAHNRNISFSGRGGNSSFSFSSSSTSGSWNGHQNYNTGNGYPAPPPVIRYPTLPVPPSYQYQSVPSTPMPQQMPRGYAETVPPTPIILTPAAIPASVQEPVQTPTQAPMQVPMQAPTQAPAQNSRMYDAFQREFDGETYFSNPPGSPDRSTGDHGALQGSGGT